MTNTTPGLKFMETVKAQIEAEPRFAKLKGHLELRQCGLGTNPDGSPYLGLYFIADVMGHEYVHSLNACQRENFSPGHPTYGEYGVTMVTRYPKRFHECYMDDQKLAPQGMDTVLKYLKSGLAKYRKTIKIVEARKAAGLSAY